MTETWRDIPGYEGLYQVSDMGNVKSLDAVIKCSGTVKGNYLSMRKGKMLRPGKMPSGHVSVSLGKNNSVCVHTLVLLAFVGAPAKGFECLHNNGVPNDNRLLNLRWGTRSDNLRDKVRLGEGTKLTWDDVIAIKDALLTPYRGIGRALAKKYDVTECSISAIKHGRDYAHVIR